MGRICYLFLRTGSKTPGDGSPIAIEPFLFILGAAMAVEFKILLKHLRLRANYGLRRFAELVGESPSNYAGVESGQRAPWRSPEKLRRVAEALALREGSEDWDAFFTAAKGYVGLPPDVEQILEQPYVPALLRIVGTKRLNTDELRALVEDGVFEKAIEQLRKKREKQNGPSGRTN